MLLAPQTQQQKVCEARYADFKFAGSCGRNTLLMLPVAAFLSLHRCNECQHGSIVAAPDWIRNARVRAA